MGNFSIEFIVYERKLPNNKKNNFGLKTKIERDSCPFAPCYSAAADPRTETERQTVGQLQRV